MQAVREVGLIRVLCQEQEVGPMRASTKEWTAYQKRRQELLLAADATETEFALIAMEKVSVMGAGAAFAMELDIAMHVAA